MEIVRAQLEDLPRALQLYRSCTRAMQAAGNPQWGDDYPTEEVIRKDIESGWMDLLYERNGAHGDGGGNGALLAAISLNEEQAEAYKTLRWSAPDRALVVHRLCVEPARQRSGIAGRMMDFAEERARREGYPSMRLDTYSGNPAALRLYESRGYRRTGEVYFRGRPLAFVCFEKLFPAAVRP